MIAYNVLVDNQACYIIPQENFWKLLIFLSDTVRETQHYDFLSSFRVLIPRFFSVGRDELLTCMYVNQAETFTQEVLNICQDHHVAKRRMIVIYYYTISINQNLKSQA